MSENTINADVTMGGANATLLANRYRVVRPLGQGGMGSVWLAVDMELDNHPVAIKMLPSVLVSNRRAYNQLKAEALVALKLTHPNIATVRAFEENDGNPFLVIDYIDGVTLDDYLAEKGRLAEDEAIRLLKPIALALDYAHGEGVVHRDVKPGNVMIRKDGHPFVLDFGIAREIQETMTHVTGRLSSGTLMYMSPEQLQGAVPTAAQDIYSFAAMAYECLSGEPPFSRGQIEWQIVNTEPKKLPAGSVLAESVLRSLGKTANVRADSCTAVISPAIAQSVEHDHVVSEVLRDDLQDKRPDGTESLVVDDPRDSERRRFVSFVLWLVSVLVLACAAIICCYRQTRPTVSVYCYVRNMYVGERIEMKHLKGAWKQDCDVRKGRALWKRDIVGKCLRRNVKAGDVVYADELE